jgi:ankyrin repeat protein
MGSKGWARGPAALAVTLALLALGVSSVRAQEPARAVVADAAMRGDRAGLRALIAQGADVNGAQGDGMTALHWAAELGDVETARLLLAARAQVGPVTRIGGYTPLHIAAEGGHGALVRVLLEAGADARSPRLVAGTTPLHYAAAAGSVEAIDALIDRGARIDAQEATWGQTPLMFAASKDRADAVRRLLARGADPSVKTRVLEISRRATQDWKELQERPSAAAAYRVEASDLDLGDPTGRGPGGPLVPVERITRVDWDSLQMAGRPLRYADLVGYQGGLTALLHAIREGNRGAALALLDGGADVNEPSAGDLTPPLLMAMINGHFDLGLELLARGADPRGASDAGATPLYAALNTRWAPQALYPQQQSHQQQKATYLEVMEALLRAGADPNARLQKHLWYMEYSFNRLGVDTWGATAFWRAAFALDVDAMRLLARHGADPTIPTRRPAGRIEFTDIPPDEMEAVLARDVSGLPPVPVGGPGAYPIHAATGFGGTGVARGANVHNHAPDGWLPAVRYLVEDLRADPSQRDYLGFTPMHHAAGRGLDDVIRYLVAKGADPGAVSRAGLTTADMANGPVSEGARPFPSTITLLEGLGARRTRPCVQC